MGVHNRMRKKKSLSILLILTLICLLFGCSRKSSTTSQDNNTITDDPEKDKGPSWPTKEWSTSTPEQQGIDSAVLEEADKRINKNYPNVYSLLVIRHGYLVYEKYYHGMDEENANPVYSVTKSVMSALTGIAIDQKLIQNVNQKVSEYLPDYFSQVDDKHKNDITIRDVLTMSGGLESIDTNYPSYFTSNDWLKYALEKPLTDVPGEIFVYNTGLTHFLSGIISKVSKMSTMEFANQYLFSQIGISADTWWIDQAGYYCGGSGLELTPRDMAKFGYLYLNNGVWDGKQVIPKAWIEESTSKQITANEFCDYGYLFWLQTIQDKVHNKEFKTFRADGAGGQKIMVIPELDMIAVVTADENTSSVDKTDTQDIISDFIIPAVK
jgi:CubicO group peptidase (beta-lactamase class C family)